MAEKIKSKEVLEADSVGDVHPETSFERRLRILRPVAHAFALYLIVGATFTVCVCVLFSSNPDLAHYRAGAWGTLTGIAGAALGTLFGSTLLPKLDS